MTIPKGIISSQIKSRKGQTVINKTLHRTLQVEHHESLQSRARVAQWVRLLDYLTTRTSLSPIWRGFTTGFVNYKKDALDSQPQVIKFTSCLPRVGVSLRVLRLLPPLKLVAMI